MISKFSNGETKIKLTGNEFVVKDRIAYVDFFFHYNENINDELFQLFLTLDAINRMVDIDGISLYLPFIPYLRQDRCSYGEPLSAKVILQILESLNVKTIKTIEPHFYQVQGFSNIKIIYTTLDEILTKWFSEQDIVNAILVAPDEGRRKTVEKIAKATGLESMVCPKIRDDNGQVIRGAINIPSDKSIYIIDDMIDTGGTMLSIIDSLNNENINLVIAHGIYSNDFLDKLPENVQIFACDTIQIENNKIHKIK